ncbi:MAG: hypothetical protein QG629_715 [Patescibacteria group bacterium]|nr:DHH family phosphoesterase [Candidatus Saccharibacteria bacterium]MDQ5963632.1 hypothetical protein [Patescibacteria group bacterium]
MKEEISQAVQDAKNIVVIQADNPDADSLGSALALEEILEEQGKHVALYCGVQVPEYLRYLEGWDRIEQELPKGFDLSIIVDASTYTLFDKLCTSGGMATVQSKPCVVLDHHATVENPLDFTDLQLVDGSISSTGELIYSLATESNWPLTAHAAECIMAAVLGDTQGLTNNLTTTTTYRLMATLTEVGADRSKLEELRREYGKMPESIYRYKGDLIAKTELHTAGKVALVHVPQDEINTFSPLYNPAALIQFDMLQIKNIAIAIVLKSYDDGRVTGALRANLGYPICGKLAEAMGGGGHDYASGFKTTDRPYEEAKNELLRLVNELLLHEDVA